MRFLWCFLKIEGMSRVSMVLIFEAVFPACNKNHTLRFIHNNFAIIIDFSRLFVILTKTHIRCELRSKLFLEAKISFFLFLISVYNYFWSSCNLMNLHKILCYSYAIFPVTCSYHFINFILVFQFNANSKKY